MVTTEFGRYKFSLTGPRLLFSNRIFMLELVCGASAQSSATFAAQQTLSFVSILTLTIDAQKANSGLDLGERLFQLTPMMLFVQSSVSRLQKSEVNNMLQN